LSHALPQEIATPRFLRLREFETVDVPANDVLVAGRVDMYSNLEGKGYFTVQVGRAATRFQAKGHIGVIPINDRLTVEVVPRVPIAGLSRLLEVSGSAPVALLNALRPYRVGDRMYPSLAAVYAAGLRSEVEAIAAKGFLKDYKRVDEVTSFPRGRVDMNRTIQQGSARGITHRAAVSRFERSMDVGANRCLLYAAWRLSRYAQQVGPTLRQRQQRGIQRDLNVVWQLLQGVKLDWTEQFLQDGWVSGAQTLPTVRDYYRSALDLALVIIGRQALLIEDRGSHVHLPSLVLDMATMFESYLRNVLISASRAEAWPVDVLDGRKAPPEGGRGRLFETGDNVVATPDVVLRQRGSPSRTYPVIIEVKYKPADGTPARQDLNQAITYALAYGSRHVVLAQPRSLHPGSTPGLRLMGEIGGITVSQYVIDLASDDLAREEEAWSRVIHDLTTA